MESGQSSHTHGNNDPMKLMSLDFCGENDNLAVTDHVPSLGHHDLTDQNTHQIMNLMESGKTSWTTQAEPLNMPWWVQHQEASSQQSYAKFLLESSSSSHFPIPTPSSDHKMKLELFPLPAYGVSHSVSDVNSDMSYNHCLGMACGSTSSEMDALELRLLMQHNEAVGNCFTSESDNQTQSSWRQNLSGDNSYTSTVPQAASPIVRVAPMIRSLSPAESSGTKAKATMKDRNRKIRIHEKLNALQELLPPQSGEVIQACVLDDVIDHIKFLQLKIKDLCKTRLEGESTVVPIIFHEGYGHYLSDNDQQILDEPLEEMVGKLLVQNPSRVMQLLEMKGLVLLPIDFTQGLFWDSA